MLNRLQNTIISYNEHIKAMEQQISEILKKGDDDSKEQLLDYSIDGKSALFWYIEHHQDEMEKSLAIMDVYLSGCEKLLSAIPQYLQLIGVEIPSGQPNIAISPLQQQDNIAQLNTEQESNRATSPVDVLATNHSITTYYSPPLMSQSLFANTNADPTAVNVQSEKTTHKRKHADNESQIVKKSATISKAEATYFKQIKNSFLKKSVDIDIWDQLKNCDVQTLKNHGLLNLIIKHPNFNTYLTMLTDEKRFDLISTIANDYEFTKYLSKLVVNVPTGLNDGNWLNWYIQLLSDDQQATFGQTCLNVITLGADIPESKLFTNNILQNDFVTTCIAKAIGQDSTNYEYRLNLLMKGRYNPDRQADVEIFKSKIITSISQSIPEFKEFISNSSKYSHYLLLETTSSNRPHR